MLTAAICLFSGAMLGLCFNVKMLAHVTLVFVVFGVGAAFFMQASIASIATLGLIAVVALQGGYFMTLLLSAMGHVRQNAIQPFKTPAEAEATNDALRDRVHLPR